MQFKRMPLGIYQANCYVITDENTKETAVIDPGGDFEELKHYLEENQLKVKYIILTHGHGDHIGALPQLKEYTAAPVCIHSEDSRMLKSANRNMSSMIARVAIEMDADLLLQDGEQLQLGGTLLEIIHTPGHTKGSICIKCEDHLFSGDTLFARSIGRTDLEGGSYEEIIESIRTKLFVLPEETIVFSGHGGRSTIGTEKAHNPFFRA